MAYLQVFPKPFSLPIEISLPATGRRRCHSYNRSVHRQTVFLSFHGTPGCCKSPLHVLPLFFFSFTSVESYHEPLFPHPCDSGCRHGAASYMPVPSICACHTTLRTNSCLSHCPPSLFRSTTVILAKTWWALCVHGWIYFDDGGQRSILWKLPVGRTHVSSLLSCLPLSQTT